MANWYYYNENGEKIGPIRGRELKQLAKEETITPETSVEDEKGRVALAKNVTGLTFPKAVHSEPTQPESDSSTIIPTTQNNTSQSMSNYFYFDENGYKYGPFNGQKLRELAIQGAITPNTHMETDTGQKGTAGQIPGLFAAVPSQPDQPVPSPAPSFKDRVAAVAKKGMEWSKDAYQKAAPQVITATEKVKNMASPPAPQVTADALAPSEPSSGQPFKMKYERNKAYFEPEVPEQSTLPGIILTFIGVITLPIIIGFVLLPIGILLWIGAAKSNKSRIVVTDAEIDHVCQNRVNNLEEIALKKLGIKKKQVEEAKPIQIADYYYGDISEDCPYLEKQGKDGMWRSSNYNAMVFFFSKDQVYGFCFRFSLLEDEKLEISDECFYGDIVSLSVAYKVVTRKKKLGNVGQLVEQVAVASNSSNPLSLSGLIGRLLWGKNKNIGVKNTGGRKNETIYFGQFTLTTSARTTMEVTFRTTAIETVEASINGMRNLLRDKKRHLERYDTSVRVENSEH